MASIKRPYAKPVLKTAEILSTSVLLACSAVFCSNQGQVCCGPGTANEGSCQPAGLCDEQNP